jgi:hypothetical protein
MILASMVMALSAGFASADDFAIDAGMITTDTMHPYGHIFTHEVGSFTDTIDFTIPYGSVGSSVNPLLLTLGGVNVYDITNLTYSVFGGVSGGNGQPYGTFLGDNTSHDVPLSLAGAYHILVTGYANGSSGGAYGIALVSGVPEAETYTMLLGGIALLGVVARRRRNKQA